MKREDPCYQSLAQQLRDRLDRLERDRGRLENELRSLKAAWFVRRGPEKIRSRLRLVADNTTESMTYSIRPDAPDASMDEG
jgi:transposase